MTFATLLRIVIGLTSVGFIASSLGLLPSGFGLEMLSPSSANGNSDAAVHDFGETGFSEKTQTPVQRAFYQAQASLSDGLPDLPMGGYSSDAQVAAPMAGLPTLPNTNVSGTSATGGPSVFPGQQVMPDPMSQGLPNSFQSTVGVPVSPPPNLGGGQPNSLMPDPLPVMPNEPAALPSQVSGPSSQLGQSQAPSVMPGQMQNDLRADSGFRPRDERASSADSNYARAQRELEQQRQLDQRQLDQRQMEQIQFEQQQQRAQRERARQANAGSIEWNRAPREAVDSRVQGQQIGYQNGQVTQASGNDLRAIDNLGRLQKEQPQTGRRLNPNTFTTGLPFVTPPPRGRFATSPYNHAVFQTASYNRRLAESASRAAAASGGPGQLASAQLPAGSQLRPTGESQPGYVQPGFVQPGIYPTAAYQCGPYLPQFARPQIFPASAQLPQPSLPPPSLPQQGQVPGTWTPPTYTPNLTPGLYSPNNSGYSPLMSLGQEGYNVQLGRGLLGQPTVYVPGQPFRNFMRYLSP